MVPPTITPPVNAAAVFKAGTNRFAVGCEPIVDGMFSCLTLGKDAGVGRGAGGGRRAGVGRVDGLGRVADAFGLAIFATNLSVVFNPVLATASDMVKI